MDKVTKITGEDSNVTKFTFEDTGENPCLVEAVLYKYPTYKERTVICVSTMSGCPVGCTFCGSGKFHVRNLTAREIVEQVIECLKEVIAEEHIAPMEIENLQIMFMSMGEPMLNWKELKKAINTLYMSMPEAKLLISTIGPDVPEAFKELTELSKEIPQIGLQFSVHEVWSDARDRLIPFKGKMDLVKLASVGFQWYMATGRKPFFNYCVHSENNSLLDAGLIAARFNPDFWEATVSVICEKDESVQSSIERQATLASDFSGLLVTQGFNTRVFNPAGQDDIGGGCGQLWHVQKWVEANPEYARVSAGCKQLTGGN